MLGLRTSNDDGDRFPLWPVGLRFAWRHGAWRTWFTAHGWPAGHDLVPDSQTSRGCVPGLRRLTGQTLHLGPIKVTFGRSPTQEQRELVDAWCRYQEVVRQVLPNRPTSLAGDPMRTHWALMYALRHIERVELERRRAVAKNHPRAN